MKMLLLIHLLFICYISKAQVLDPATIIGKSFPIIVGDFQVAEYDFPIKMNWKDANNECAKLGNGWRLPNKEELNFLYKNHVKIGMSSRYWSSTESGNDSAWSQSMSYYDLFMKENKNILNNIRAIRENIYKGQVLDSANIIIGKSIKFQNFQVAENDFPIKMKRNDAIDKCVKLGEGWRLPTIDELEFLYNNKDRIDGLYEDDYWSSSDHPDWGGWNMTFRRGLKGHDNVNYSYNVRAVKGILSKGQLSDSLPIIISMIGKSIIGKAIKIGNIIVAQNDFPKTMKLFDAERACILLGKGWRLPTQKELNILYVNRKKIGGFSKYNYSSSTGSGNLGFMWIQDFVDGRQTFGDDSEKFYVRAVRFF